MDKERRKQLAMEYKMKPVAGGVYAVKNKQTGRVFVKGDSNLDGSRNRFEFAKKTGCSYAPLCGEWETYGAACFEFAVLEETKQGETESSTAFRERLKKMEEAWREKLSSTSLA